MNLFRYNLRVAIRRLRRQKGYAVINVLGLALGLAVCGVLLLFVRHETSYEAFHQDAERVHLLRSEGTFAGQTTTSTLLPAPIGPAVAQALPEVERTVRVAAASRLRIRLEGELHEVRHAFSVDPHVFDVFTFPVVAGDPATALLEPGTVVIDETLAHELYGDVAPREVLDRLLELESGSLRITGVMAQVPPNTHWRPRALLSMAGQTDLDDPEALRTQTHSVYVLFHDGADPEAAMSKAAGALAPVLQGSVYSEQTFHSRPIRQIHLRGTGTSGPAGASAARSVTDPSVARLRIFGAVGMLILLLAAINYVNLATAYGLSRAREVGVRKTLGARRRQLSSHFLAESVLVTLAAGALALVLVSLALGPFAATVGAELAVRPAEWVPLGAAFLGFAVVVGLGAGAYPALALSRARPSDAFRASAPRGLSGQRVRHGLVLFQFGVSIALLVSTLVMTRQLDYMQREHLGLEPEHVLVVSFPFGFGASRFDAVTATMEQYPAVRETAGMLFHPGHGTRAFEPVVLTSGGPSVQMHVFFLEPEARQVLRMELLTGTDLPERWSAAEARPVLLTESAAALVGWSPEEAVGQDLVAQYGPRTLRVAGVVRDFHYASLREPIEPVMIYAGTPEQRLSLLVRFAPGDEAAVLEVARIGWAEVAGEEPLRAYFLGDTYAELYDAERRLASLFGAFGALAVLIACMGLFGLAAFMAARRVKEISIRKVLGASTASIVALLSRDLVVLLALAFAVASPVAYWVMNRWLEGFAYRIGLGPGVFILAGGLALAVALATVSYHALRAANADPVGPLRAD